jgi:chromate reductase, NAD(P)H dehydrogenase (quinone)
VICSPEYAHGVPGSLKNALDWLVSGVELSEKPVAVITATPFSTHALAQLIETLRTMNARVIADACVTLPAAARGLDVDGLTAHAVIAGLLRQALDALLAS